MTLPEALYRAEQTRELDRIAINTAGIASGELMARAGQAAFDLLRFRWPRARTVVVVCGAGNNAGDGYVLARLAVAAGLTPQVLAVADPAKLKGDAQAAHAAYVAAGGTVTAYQPEHTPDADVVVDAILGTGLERAVSGQWQAAIAAINRQPAPVLAIDIPSGLSADTGAIMGTAVVADVTISFIGLKPGLLTGRGVDCAGEVVFHDLAVPAAVYAQVPVNARRLSRQALQGLLPARRPSSHKSEQGRVVAIGGAPGTAGAIVLAGSAACHAGAGLVCLGTDPGHASALISNRPELMSRGLADYRAARELLAWGAVAVIGPGLGQGKWAQQLFQAAVDSRLPLVVDADGLNLLAGEPLRRDNWLLTPHPGEAARLLQSTTDEVERDRPAAVSAISERYGGVCVLKGAGSLIAGAGIDRLALCNHGNAGMAVAGTGDILSGVLAALIGQGLAVADAARLGVWVHALAGDRWRQQQGERGMLASELLPLIRQQLNLLA